MIQEEKWDTFYPDCMPLFAEHKAEIGESSEKMPVDPDINKVAALDKAGMALIVTSRNEVGEMQGYCTFIIDNSVESKNVLIGEQKLWFVTKAARQGGLAIRLFLEAKKRMAARGVKNIYPHLWMNAPLEIREGLHKFFTGMGAYELERVYSLEL